MTALLTAWGLIRCINPRAAIMIAVILATVGFTAWVMSVVDERDRLISDLDKEKRKVIVKQIEIDQLQESIQVYRVYREQQLETDRQFEELVRNLEAIEGGDAPLSDFMRDAAGRLFGNP